MSIQSDSMKCKLPNQESGSSRFYIGKAMGEYYDPPGVEVVESDDGIKYVRVKSEVGQILIEEFGFEEITEESTNDDSN